MQKRACRDIRIPLCGDKKAWAGARGSCVVRGGEGAEGSFFFDDEDPIADLEG